MRSMRQLLELTKHLCHKYTPLYISLFITVLFYESSTSVEDFQTVSKEMKDRNNEHRVGFTLSDYFLMGGDYDEMFWIQT